MNHNRSWTIIPLKMQDSTFHTVPNNRANPDIAIVRKENCQHRPPELFVAAGGRRLLPAGGLPAGSSRNEYRKCM